MNKNVKEWWLKYLKRNKVKEVRIKNRIITLHYINEFHSKNKYLDSHIYESDLTILVCNKKNTMSEDVIKIKDYIHKVIEIEDMEDTLYIIILEKCNNLFKQKED